MHTTDVLTDERLCTCADLETHFANWNSNEMARQGQAPQAKTTCACERVTFSDIAEVVVLLSICMLITADTKMSLFQPNCCIKNCISRCFSATVDQTEPLNACHNTTQQALSTNPYSIVSTPSLPDSDEQSKNRLISTGRGETRLNSCACEVHECRYPTDNNTASRLCCVVSIERGTAA